MKSKIEEWIDSTKQKYGLEDYHLVEQSFSRQVTIFNETDYTFSMEWFPNHVEERDDEDSNPDGTASISLNVQTGKVERVIFVMEKTYAKNGIEFVNAELEDIVKWLEKETGLIYGEQFQFDMQEEGEYRFKECYKGVAVSPSGFIELKVNHDGKLLLFSVYGHFPRKELVQEETFSLSLEKLEKLQREQLRLLEFPSFELKKLYPVYALEEIYVTNDGMSTIPFEVIVDSRGYLKIDETIVWEKPIHQSFEREVLDWSEDVTAEQAFSSEPAPDSFPISKDEQEICLRVVKEVLAQEYPDESGKWKLKTLHREERFIHAIIRANEQTNRVFQRKLMVVIDAEKEKAINMIDNNMMLEVFNEFAVAETVAITKEEAFEKLKDRFELKPYYVYDFERKKYLLCGKLDCQYGVHAGSGELVLLDDL